MPAVQRGWVHERFCNLQKFAVPHGAEEAGMAHGRARGAFGQRGQAGSLLPGSRQPPYLPWSAILALERRRRRAILLDA